jgi:hypothetical protein
VGNALSGSRHRQAVGAVAQRLTFPGAPALAFARAEALPRLGSRRLAVARPFCRVLVIKPITSRSENRLGGDRCRWRGGLPELLLDKTSQNQRALRRTGRVVRIPDRHLSARLGLGGRGDCSDSIRKFRARDDGSGTSSAVLLRQPLIRTGLIERSKHRQDILDVFGVWISLIEGIE